MLAMHVLKSRLRQDDMIAVITTVKVQQHTYVNEIQSPTLTFQSGQGMEVGDLRRMNGS